MQTATPSIPKQVYSSVNIGDGIALEVAAAQCGNDGIVFDADNKRRFVHNNQCVIQTLFLRYPRPFIQAGNAAFRQLNAPLLHDDAVEEIPEAEETPEEEAPKA